jgi:pre-mRNA-splicing factor RBM22/SLT11
MSSLPASPSDFPLLCSTCLGPNPLVRMTRQFGAKPCKICDRPFPVYRWQPGPAARFKKTELCRSCALIKNVCQTCVLDLTFGVPVQVRDSIQSTSSTALVPSLPSSEAGRAEALDRIERRLLDSPSSLLQSADSRLSQATLVLDRLGRRSDKPYYDRNLAHYCSFYAAGKCDRGSLCPFRHEFPPASADARMNKQSIKDRYIGQNDPVAERLVAKAGKINSLKRPEDPMAVTLWIGPIASQCSKQSIQAAFSEFSSEIVRIHLLPSKECAFVQFSSQDSANLAANKLNGNLKIDGIPVRVDWAKSSRETSSESKPSPAPGNAPPGVKKKSENQVSLSALPPLPQLAVEFSTSQPAYPSEQPLSQLADHSQS